MSSSDGILRLADPRAMRALAHPTRLRLLGELRLRGPQTIGTLSDLIGEAAGSVSYHIGKLAQFGFVEEAPELARNRRERWLRATHTRTQLEMDDLADPDRTAASAMLRRAMLARYIELLESYLASEASLAPQWRRGSPLNDTTMDLTSAELVELRADLDALVARWQARSDPEREGAEPVTLMYQSFRRPG